MGSGFSQMVLTSVSSESLRLALCEAFVGSGFWRTILRGAAARLCLERSVVGACFCLGALLPYILSIAITSSCCAFSAGGDGPRDRF